MAADTKSSTHTPHPWSRNSFSGEQNGVGLAEIYADNFGAPVSIARAAITNQEANAELLKLAPFAPHECSDEECPGHRVLAFLRAFVASVDYHDKHDAEGFVATMWEARDTARALLALIAKVA